MIDDYFANKITKFLQEDCLLGFDLTDRDL